MENSFGSDLEQYLRDYSASKVYKAARNLQLPLSENTRKQNQLGLIEKNELLEIENKKLTIKIRELEHKWSEERKELIDSHLYKIEEIENKNSQLRKTITNLEIELKNAQNELNSYQCKHEYLELKAKSLRNFQENRSELLKEVEKLTDKLFKFKQKKYEQFNEMSLKYKAIEDELEICKEEKREADKKISMLEQTLRHMCEEKDMRIERLQFLIREKTPLKPKENLSRTVTPLTDRNTRSISPMATSRSTFDLTKTMETTATTKLSEDFSADIKNLEKSHKKLKQKYISLITSRAHESELIKAYNKININEKALSDFQKKQKKIVLESKSFNL
ncbi:unnamed protein product [Blepharisma stoltei]|uniref:Uncharacterized protein n=1 Tax=Blepharisma stoltei TaxID=1481888 RepID=A0AAU9KKW0_9CILI|nr:unnamed protein product [Blepharisma stoltei]